MAFQRNDRRKHTIATRVSGVFSGNAPEPSSFADLTKRPATPSLTGELFESTIGNGVQAQDKKKSIALKTFPYLLDIGEAMLDSGADVHTVEETLGRMGQAYGATTMNVLVITSVIVVTMTLPDGSEYTLSRRVMSEDGTNFYQLEALTRLCNRCCVEPLCPKDLETELKRIKSVPISNISLYGGGILSAGGFAIFFGGSILDGAVSAFFAILICFALKHLRSFTPNTMIFNFGVSFVIGLLIVLSAHIIPALNTDMVMIGDIMLLIPGVAMTNATRDMLSGDTISGVMRFVESLLWATSLAFGFMVALWFGSVM